MKTLLKIFNFIILLFITILIYKYIKTDIDIYKFFFYSLVLLIFLVINIVLILIKKVNINYILILSSLIFSTYVAEVFLSFRNFYYERIFNNEYIKLKTNRVNLTSALKKEFVSNKNISISFSPNFLNDKNSNNFFFSGVSLSKTFLCNEKNPIYYYSDRFGFNNIDSNWDLKNTTLFLGDSFTQGWCVSRDQNFVSTFKENNINLGIQNTGPLAQYAILKEYINKTNIKNIYWIYDEANDLADLALESNNNVLKKYIYDQNFTQDLINLQKIINLKNKEKNNIFMSTNSFHDNSYFKQKKFYYYFLDTLYLKNLRTELNKNLFIYFTYKNIIRNTSKLLDNKEVKLFIVYLPGPDRYFNNKKGLFLNYEYKLIKFIAEHYNFEIIDLKNLFDPLPNKENLYINNYIYFHFNEYGHKKIGEFLKKLNH